MRCKAPEKDQSFCAPDKPFKGPVSERLITRGEFVLIERIRSAKYRIGQVVRHRVYPFRGVVFDVDPTFDNTEDWYEAIPEDIRPRKDQPFYHLLAENDETEYEAYVSEQNLLIDDSGKPVRHPQVKEMFGELKDGLYEIPAGSAH